MRDAPADCLRLDELIEALMEIKKEHGDMFTDVRAGSVRVTSSHGPKEMRLR